MSEDILRAYEKGFADAIESAAVSVETGYGYMNIRDIAKRIRALAKHIQPPPNPPSSDLISALEGLLAITNSLAPEAEAARIAIAKTK